MLPSAIVAAIRQVLSPPLRSILWRSLGLTALLLILVWVGLTQLVSWLLRAYPVGADYPFVGTIAFLLAGAGLFVVLAYILPAVSILVAGFFLDDAAAIVEGTDYPGDVPGQPLSVGWSLLIGLRFAALSLAVNLLALTLIFVPVVNIFAFFAANTYLFGREYFELAAARFRPMEDAVKLRRENRQTVLAAGAVIAALILVPVLNLATPLFGIALMVHMHKGVLARQRRLGRG